MKRITPLAVVTAFVLIVAACGPSSGGIGTVPPIEPTPIPSTGEPSPDLTPAPSPSPSLPTPSSGPSESPSPSPSPTPAGTMIVRAYFYLGGGQGTAGLVGVLREVPESKGVATAAMNALLGGPTASESAGRISSAIPAGSQLLGISIANGVATVDLSSEFESGGGSLSVLTRLGQVVYTLTQFPTVDSVLFRIEGKTVTVFGGEGVILDGPVARSDYYDLLPAIFVDRPVWGAAIGNPARVAGLSNVFEATSRVALLDAADRVIVDEMVMATCGTGCWGTFDVTLRYDVVKAQWGTLRVYELSARDGSPVNVRDYPVWLTPAD
ncbi:MAG TPA: Gmad2 immunoglobulin-like domain-containing protein [Candidatus Limnocylindrales bacterium]|nr:Gmad2 immunoglobulin-like domain-containing protein [Candidatus Limnocylindrales bacterium]